jgi:glutathione reductase (NADPH)
MNLMERQFDLIVLGTGSAGSAAANECRSAGWSVAIVDNRPFGGTCALRGCDPKKVLVGAGELLDWIRRMKGNGISYRSARIQWAELMNFKRQFTDPVPQSRERAYAEAGIVALHGAAHFTGPNSIQVGDESLTGRYLLVATGAKPRPLKIPGEQHVKTSDDFLELEELPKKIVFIGGGYISFEFAHLAARAGARVTIVHQGPKPLVRFDPDLVDNLVAASEERGIRVQTNTRASAIEAGNQRAVVIANAPKGKRRIRADLVVHGAGRIADIDQLELQKAGVEFSEKGIKVNEFLQSISNPAVYAAGDSAESGPPLTPVAGKEGEIAAQNMLKGNHKKVDSYIAVPSVVFSVPPLASVGLLESQVREKGLDVVANYQKTSDWYTSRRTNEKHSAHKVLIEKGSEKILGAHLLGEKSEEIINLFGAAIKFGLTSSDLKDLLYAYPTHSSNIPYMV